MFNWLKSSAKTQAKPLLVDMHSHLLPGIDDGVKTLEESAEVILFLKKLGYEKLITTPHIFSDLYRNTPEIINNKLTELKRFLKEKKIDIQLEAAAEYYLDESLVGRLNDDEQLLTFGDKYLLFETNFLTEPLNLKEFIFLASTKGYKLVMAHPERYLYLHNNFVKLEDLKNRGVFFQVNLSSLTGYYSKQAQKTAFEIINKGWVNLLGTDCHHITHAQIVEKSIAHKYYQKALSLPLLNNNL